MLQHQTQVAADGWGVLQDEAMCLIIQQALSARKFGSFGNVFDVGGVMDLQFIDSYDDDCLFVSLRLAPPHEVGSVARQGKRGGLEGGERWLEEALREVARLDQDGISRVEFDASRKVIVARGGLDADQDGECQEGIDENGEGKMYIGADIATIPRLLLPPQPGTTAPRNDGSIHDCVLLTNGIAGDGMGGTPSNSADAALLEMLRCAHSGANPMLKWQRRDAMSKAASSVTFQQVDSKLRGWARQIMQWPGGGVVGMSEPGGVTREGLVEAISKVRGEKCPGS